MGVGPALRRHAAGEDDVLGLLDLEDGSFDPVGEVGLEEREEPSRVRRCGALGEGLGRELRPEGLEERKPLGVIGEAGPPGARRAGPQVGIAGSEQRADELVEADELRMRVERGGDHARLVAQLVERLRPTDARKPVEAFLELLPAQRPGHARPGARGAQVVQGDARRARHPQPRERHVSGHRPGTAPWTQRQAREPDGARVDRATADVDEERAVRGRPAAAALRSTAAGK